MWAQHLSHIYILRFGSTNDVLGSAAQCILGILFMNYPFDKQGYCQMQMNVTQRQNLLGMQPCPGLVKHGSLSYGNTVLQQDVLLLQM